MGVKEFFNKAAKGVKTFFKKDGTLENVFKKGSNLYEKGSQLFDKNVGAALELGNKLGETTANLAPALSAIDPRLGLAAGSVGNVIAKGTKYLQGFQSKKDEIKNKLDNVRNQLTLPKPAPPEEPQNDMTQMFA